MLLSHRRVLTSDSALALMVMQVQHLALLVDLLEIVVLLRRELECRLHPRIHVTVNARCLIRVMAASLGALAPTRAEAWLRFTHARVVPS